jgi:phage terminase large subunit-like protein
VRDVRPTPPDALSELGDFRSWNAASQERALERLEQIKARPWRPFYCKKAGCDGHPHDTWDFEHARPDQRPPPWYADWLTWLLSSGRGSGKTRSGAEVTHRATNLYGRIHLIAPTGPDFRETMVEGESGIIATAKPDHVPNYEPSKKKLTWPNGAVALGFSAEEPDRLRGPQCGFTWADEPAHYPAPTKVWDNVLFGLRLKGKKGAQPKIVATSTPKPTKWMKELVAADDTVVSRASSYANLANLADSYRKNVLAKYEGTRIGRQELDGELLEDVEGALWNWDLYVWIEEPPPLKRIVVAVDPAGSANKRSDLTGIIILGLDYNNVVWVLADWSGKYTPGAWAARVISAHDFYKADAIVAEKNYGGNMVRHTLETTRTAGTLMPRIIEVDSRRGKEIRAEPVVALYEKNNPEAGVLRVVHAGKRGELSELEDEQTTWVPGETSSPNRVDAEVHGITELVGNLTPAAIATSTSIGDQYGSVPAVETSGVSNLWLPGRGYDPLGAPSPYQGAFPW